MKRTVLMALGAVAFAAAQAADVDWPAGFADDVAANIAGHAATAASDAGSPESAFDSLVGGWAAFDLALSVAAPFDSRSRTWWESAGIVFNASRPRGMSFSFR